MSRRAALLCESELCQTAPRRMLMRPSLDCRVAAQHFS